MEKTGVTPPSMSDSCGRDNKTFSERERYSSNLVKSERCRNLFSHSSCTFVCTWDSVPPFFVLPLVEAAGEPLPNVSCENVTDHGNCMACREGWACPTES